MPSPFITAASVDITLRNLLLLGKRNEQLQEEKTRLVAALREMVRSPGSQMEHHAEIAALLKEVLEPQPHVFGVRVLTFLQVSDTPDTGLLQNRNNLEQAESEPNSPGAPSEEAQSDARPPGEQYASSDVGSPGHRHLTAEAPKAIRGGGLAGYLGKLSVVSWLERARDYLSSTGASHLSAADNAYMDIHLDKVGLHYMVDDADLLELDEDYIDPHQLPPLYEAMILSEAYFHCISDAFRFVQREDFLAGLTSSYEVAARGSIPSWDQRRYLAIANMIWAIGAKWLNMTGLEGTELTNGSQTVPFSSHLMYYARARALGLDHRVQLDAPELRAVQGLGLLAFYLLTNGSIQR